jgi:hypothetical protein
MLSCWFQHEVSFFGIKNVAVLYFMLAYCVVITSLAAKFQNCLVLIVANHELSRREDCIKMRVLIHNQLQAPIYRTGVGGMLPN